jgi:hypothetical protein
MSPANTPIPIQDATMAVLSAGLNPPITLKYSGMYPVKRMNPVVVTEETMVKTAKSDFKDLDVLESLLVSSFEVTGCM